LHRSVDLGTVSPVNARSWLIAPLLLLLACDGGKPAADAKKDDAKKGDAKKGDAKKGDAKKGDAKKDDAKNGDAKAPDEGEDAPADKAAEKHFDISKDKSGILARSAAVLETDERIDAEALRDLSHHAEKLTNVEDVCRHEAKLRGTGDDIAACVKRTEHQVIKIGPEIYGQLAECILAAKTVDELDACEAAEKEAEELLHAKPHGDGLDEAACGSFFTQFEALALKDAGDQADVTKEILAEVKPDVITACVDQGTKAELECATAAKTLGELKDCASKLL